jgi:hypothetical protein
MAIKGSIGKGAAEAVTSALGSHSIVDVSLMGACTVIGKKVAQSLRVTLRRRR